MTNQKRQSTIKALEETIRVYEEENGKNEGDIFLKLLYSRLDDLKENTSELSDAKRTYALWRSHQKICAQLQEKLTNQVDKLSEEDFKKYGTYVIEMTAKSVED